MRRMYGREEYVHILLGVEKRHWKAAAGGRGRSREGRGVPLGQEAIRTLIFAPLIILRVSVFYLRVQKVQSTRDAVSTTVARIEEVG